MNTPNSFGTRWYYCEQNCGYLGCFYLQQVGLEDIRLNNFLVDIHFVLLRVIISVFHFHSKNGKGNALAFHFVCAPMQCLIVASLFWKDDCILDFINKVYLLYFKPYNICARNGMSSR